MIHLDGAQGEGGGQVLRTALALSMLTGRPLHIYNIRAARRRPGLRQQHLTAVLAAQTISGAEVRGAELGASELTFRPGAVRPGDYRFDIGTAGSTTLLAQALIPPLLTASGPSRLTLRGGTHNPQSPPFEFMEQAFLPLLERMGARSEATLVRPGYYPAGGGQLVLRLEPIRALRPIELTHRGRLRATRAVAIVARLPASIARRELDVVRDQLGWQDLVLQQETRSAGPGNVLLLQMAFDNLSEVFSGFGQRGRPAETVALGAVRAAQSFLASNAAVGANLADQLLLPLAMAGGGAFTTLEPTPHTLTNAAVVQQFLPVTIDTTRKDEHCWQVRLTRRSRRPDSG